MRFVYDAFSVSAQREQAPSSGAVEIVGCRFFTVVGKRERSPVGFAFNASQFRDDLTGWSGEVPVHANILAPMAETGE